MKDFAPILVIVIVVIAVLASAPESSNIFSGKNVNNTGSQTQSAQTGGQSGNQTSNQTQQARNSAQGLSSPFANYVVIKNLQNAEDFVNTENVTIGTRETNAPINITGWRIVSEVTGRGATIGSASTLPRKQPEQPLSLSSNQEVVLVSGTSPIGESFRLNTCTGYFQGEQNFTPELPKECPYIDRNTLPYAVRDNATCMNYVGSFSYCKIPPANAPDEIPSFCEAYVKENMSYDGCVKARQTDSDFYKSRWMVYLNSRTPLWQNGGERLNLLDSQGKLVAVFPR